MTLIADANSPDAYPPRRETTRIKPNTSGRRAANENVARTKSSMRWKPLTCGFAAMDKAEPSSYTASSIVEVNKCSLEEKWYKIACLVIPRSEAKSSNEVES